MKREFKRGYIIPIFHALGSVLFTTASIFGFLTNNPLSFLFLLFALLLAISAYMGFTTSGISVDTDRIIIRSTPFGKKVFPVTNIESASIDWKRKNVKLKFKEKMKPFLVSMLIIRKSQYKELEQVLTRITNSNLDKQAVN